MNLEKRWVIEYLVVMTARFFVLGINLLITQMREDFLPRHKLDRHRAYVSYFSWTEEDFLDKTEGSPITKGWL